MPWFDTAELNGTTMRTLNPDQASWIYNGLDCCVTFEVHERLREELAVSPAEVQFTYEMALAKQAPYLEMSMRGIKIDQPARLVAVAALQKLLDGLESRFQRVMEEVFDHRLNWRSPAQLKTLFYGELNIKEIRKRNSKGEYSATVDEATLVRLQLHPIAQPLALYILAMREIGKKITFFKTEIDADARIRCNINVVGTDTGRLSSSSNDFGTGTNLQNVDKTIRTPFIADPKKFLVECDLEQADSRNLGAILWNLFLDSHGPEEAGKYLDACESGDLHTAVAEMVWNELDWSGPSKRDVADGDFIPGKSYRDASKTLGHGTNYRGQPPTMAKNTGIQSGIIKEFQRRYFTAFPLIPEWHTKRIEEIKSFGVLTTVFGRRRFFFGRGDDSTTHRAAIAYEPQSMTGHEMDMGVLNLWRNSYSAQWANAERSMAELTKNLIDRTEAELLMQVHDSILFEVPFHNHQSHIEKAIALLHFKTVLKGGREFTVPLGAKAGWNWGYAGADNPLGLAKWKGKADTRQPPVTTRFADFF